MIPLLQRSEAFVDWLVRTSWQAGVLIVAILLAQLLLRRWLTAWGRYALWSLLVVRLVLPAMPSSSFSAFNLAPASIAPMASIQDELPPVRIFIDASGALPATPAVAKWNWRHGVAVAWALGGLGMLLRMAIRHRMLAMIIRRGDQVKAGPHLALLDRCKKEMCVSRTLRLVATDEIGGPALAGVLRPCLLMPMGTLESLSAAELRFVFLHELAHLRKRDLLSDRALDLIRAVHWFNPLVHAAFARLRADRELVRDEMVVKLSGRGSRAPYGETVLRLATWGRRGVVPAAVGMSDGRGDLGNRIDSLVRPKNVITGAVLAMAMMAALAYSLLTDRESWAAADPAAKPPVLQPAEEPAANPPDTVQSAPSVLKFFGAEPLTPPAVERAADPTPQRPAEAPRQRPPAAPMERQTDFRSVAEMDPDPKIAALMQRKLPEVRMDGLPLVDAIDFLRDVSGAQISVDWRGLEDAGIDQQVPVKVMLKDLTFRRALTAVLDSVDSKTMRFAVVNGVIAIATVDRIYQHAVIHVYDVRDLLKNAAEPDEQAQVIAEILEQTVDPEGWKRLPPIKHLSGQLIVTNISENHATIIAILNRLRQANGQPIELQMHVLQVTKEFMKNVEVEGRALMADKGVTERMTVVSEEALKLLLDSAKSAPGCRLIAAPKLTVMDRQTGEISIGDQAGPELSISVKPSLTANRDGFRIGMKADLPGEPKSETITMDIPMMKAAVMAWEDSLTMVVVRPSLKASSFPAGRR